MGKNFINVTMKSRARILSYMLIIMVFMFSFVMVANAAGKTVYVSGTGKDSNSGLSKGAPVATFEKAFALLDGAGGNIVVCGNLSVGPASDDYRALQELPQTGLVTISCTDAATITVPGKGIWFYSDTLIQNAKLNFTYSAYSAYLVANGYKMTIGKNVEVKAKDRYPIIYGGGFYSFLTVADGANSNITVESGQFEAIFGGGGTHVNDSHEDDIDGNVAVSIKGGNVGTIYGGGNGGIDNKSCVFVNGNVVISVSNGTVGSIYTSGATALATINGNAKVTISGGTISGKVASYADGVKGTIKGKTTFAYTDNKYKDLASGFSVSKLVTATEANADMKAAAAAAVSVAKAADNTSTVATEETTPLTSDTTAQTTLASSDITEQSTLASSDMTEQSSTVSSETTEETAAVSGNTTVHNTPVNASVIVIVIIVLLGIAIFAVIRLKKRSK